MSGILYGVHPLLEEEADRLLAEHLKGITKNSEKSDMLTFWKSKRRKSREVLVPSGTPDQASRRGYFHRAANSQSPHLNSREGKIVGRRDTSGKTASFTERYFDE